MHLLITLFIGFLSLWGVDGCNGRSTIIILPSPAGVIVAGQANIAVLSHPSDKSKGIAILPIDYYTPESNTTLIWSAPAGNISIPLSIHTLAYPSETLSVDPSKVTPPPEALAQIEREKVRAKELYDHFTPIRYWNKPFIQPLESNITSEYGSARTYNDVLKSYHGGVDFRARTPIPIQATNNGIVVLVEDRYYTGGTIIIDHGEGLYSCYFHLSHYDVKIGDYVAQGQNIALSGDSGRITGPHLHFGMVVHGIQADPLDLIEKINALLH